MPHDLAGVVDRSRIGIIEPAAGRRVFDVGPGASAILETRIGKEQRINDLVIPNDLDRVVDPLRKGGDIWRGGWGGGRSGGGGVGAGAVQEADARGVISPDLN